MYDHPFHSNFHPHSHELGQVLPFYASTQAPAPIIVPYATLAQPGTGGGWTNPPSAPIPIPMATHALPSSLSLEGLDTFVISLPALIRGIMQELRRAVDGLPPVTVNQEEAQSRWSACSGSTIHALAAINPIRTAVRYVNQQAAPDSLISSTPVYPSVWTAPIAPPLPVEYPNAHDASGVGQEGYIRPVTETSSHGPGEDGRAYAAPPRAEAPWATGSGHGWEVDGGHSAVNRNAVPNTWISSSADRTILPHIDMNQIPNASHASSSELVSTSWTVQPAPKLFRRPYDLPLDTPSSRPPPEVWASAPRTKAARLTAPLKRSSLHPSTQSFPSSSQCHATTTVDQNASNTSTVGTAHAYDSDEGSRPSARLNPSASAFSPASSLTPSFPTSVSGQGVEILHERGATFYFHDAKLRVDHPSNLPDDTSAAVSPTAMARSLNPGPEPVTTGLDQSGFDQLFLQEPKSDSSTGFRENHRLSQASTSTLEKAQSSTNDEDDWTSDEVYFSGLSVTPRRLASPRPPFQSRTFASRDYYHASSPELCATDASLRAERSPPPTRARDEVCSYATVGAVKHHVFKRRRRMTMSM